MASRLSAFVVPSETFTLRFDPTATPLASEAREPRTGRRAAVGLLVSFTVVVLAAIASTAQASPHAPAAPSPRATAVGAVPTAAAPAAVAVPDPMPALYASAAATCPGLPASVLAAIHRVETHSSMTGSTSVAGALGPMQFLPSTWAAYGLDADGDGRADVDDIVDAVYTAADYLCRNGGAEPARLRDALWNYNHSWDYVEQVLATAAG